MNAADPPATPPGPPPTSVRVTRGRFVIDAVDELPGSDHHRAYLIDCRSKYPEAVTGGGLDDRIANVVILPSEGRSLHLDETTDAATAVAIRVPDGWENWKVVVDGGRYTVFVVLLRLDAMSEVWRAVGEAEGAGLREPYDWADDPALTPRADTRTAGRASRGDGPHRTTRSGRRGGLSRSGSQARRTADRIDAAHARIPDPGCKGLCFESCHSVAMTPAEQKRIYTAAAIRPPLVYADLDTPCAALGADGRCRVYRVRPTVCRLYGAVEEIPCPHGCTPPGGPMPPGEGHRVLAEVRRAGGDGGRYDSADDADPGMLIRLACKRR